MSTPIPRRMSEIPAEWLARLNRGEVETRTLVESLAIDYPQLLRAVDPGISEEELAPVREASGVVERTRVGGEVLFRRHGADAFPRFSNHRSDVVRSMAAYALACGGGGIASLLSAVKPLAVDGHSGVREWAWMALRPGVIADLETALAELTTWVHDEDANARRYASEITRPRGVWCAHSRELRQAPERGLCVIEPLRADPSRYVQNSVANWLNDASKDQPGFVRETCARWSRESATKATEYIVRRALRTLTKNG